MKRPVVYLLSAVLCLLLMSTVAVAAEITVPTEVAEHTLVICTNPEPGLGHLWFVTGPRGFEMWKPIAPNQSAIVFTGPPGQYMIMLAVSLEGGQFDQGQAVVMIGGDPGPDPFPDPVPPGTLSIVMVGETRDRTGRQAIVLLGLRQFLEKESIPFRPVDPDVTDLTGNAPPWLVTAKEAIESKKVELPVLVIGNQLKDGVFSVVAVKPLPATVDAAVKLVEAYR